MEKKYKAGMFGGKFMPFHKGHLYCVDYAAAICEKLYVLMFYGGYEETEILKSNNYSFPTELLSVESRANIISRACSYYPDAEFHMIDISGLKNPDGTDNWDLETELVLDICGHFDIVFSGSDAEYGDYFGRAYPWAEFKVIDPGRTHYPISGTMIRAMREMEAEKWLV